MEPFDTFLLKKIFVQIGGVIAIAAILGVFILAYQGTYSTVVSLDNQAGERWAAVTRDLSTRYEGIPGLAARLGPSLGPDAPVLAKVTRDLGLWQAAMSGGRMPDINSATTNLEASLASLGTTLGRRPDLAATGDVKDFQATLERTEEEIAADREIYDEGVREYNRAIGTFPASLWTENWQFVRREYFTAKIGAREPPSAPEE